MDLQLLLLRRQYFQLFEPAFIAWPPSALLKSPDIQAWIFENLFNEENVVYLPPERYQLRVLKQLVTRIEKAIDNPDEDVCGRILWNTIQIPHFNLQFLIYFLIKELSDGLVDRLSVLMASGLPDEGTAVQQKSYVTFSCAHSDVEYPKDAEPAITLLERRHLISGSLTTGFRTWEAALHLGSYLLTPAGSELIRAKSVLELGAGTGFLSLIGAKYLQAKHVTVTDGDEGVVEALKENLFLNGLDEAQVNASVLRWGRCLVGTWVQDDCEAWPYDIVLGADITYDKVAISALVATFRFLFSMRPKLRIIVSGAVRNAETFETFKDNCPCAHLLISTCPLKRADVVLPVRNKFDVVEIDFPAKPMREQTVLFYATAVPLKIVSITPTQLD